MKIPGLDHPITVTPTEAPVVVKAGDRVIASTERALTLQESTYPAVQYVPLEGGAPGGPVGAAGGRRPRGARAPRALEPLPVQGRRLVLQPRARRRDEEGRGL